jgi:hypothetical protein
LGRPAGYGRPHSRTLWDQNRLRLLRSRFREAKAAIHGRGRSFTIGSDAVHVYSSLLIGRMAKRVLLVAVMPKVLEGVLQDLHMPDIELLTGANIDDVRSALTRDDVDHIILGAALTLEARQEIVKHVFQSSDRATLHMKDPLSGPEGFLPFVRSVLAGLAHYQATPSPNATLRANRS